MRKILIIVIILLLSVDSYSARIIRKNSQRNVEKGLFGKSRGNKKKVKDPRSVTRAIRKQEANDKKLKKDYALAIKMSKERTVEIQTPEVQARMKQDQKDINSRNKAKKQKQKTITKKAGKKYA